ncbi:MAG: rhodanese-like domain-containing protein [Chloroflexota bacterium]|nr:rhodanese-like domain-containing protein [Chloroflexota bacterium]
MAKTFMQMVAEARQEVPGVSPADAQQRLQQDPNTLMIDVREPEGIRETGAIPGSKNVPLGMLAIKADQELPEQMRDPQLQDRSTPIIVTCAAGGQASLGAKTLKDMGFTNVSYVEGGTRGWKEAGLPTEQP